MSKKFQFLGRNITWVQDEPGPVLVLIIALVFTLGIHCYVDTTAPADTSAQTSQNDAH